MFIADDVFRHIMLCMAVLVFNQFEYFDDRHAFRTSITWQSLKALHERLDRSLPATSDEIWRSSELGREPEAIGIESHHWGTKLLLIALGREQRSGPWRGALFWWDLARATSSGMSLLALSWRFLYGPGGRPRFLVGAGLIVPVALIIWLLAVAVLAKREREDDPYQRAELRALKDARLRAQSLRLDRIMRELILGGKLDQYGRWKGPKSTTGSGSSTTKVELNYSRLTVHADEICVLHAYFENQRLNVVQLVEGPWIEEMKTALNVQFGWRGMLKDLLYSFRHAPRE